MKMSKKGKKKRGNRPFVKKYKRKIEINSTVSTPIRQGEEITVKCIKGETLVCDSKGIPFPHGKTTMVEYYQGENKRRVTTKATHLSYATDRVDSWIVNFDRIYAIDTNTCIKPIGNYNCSVGAVMRCDNEMESDIQGILHGNIYFTIHWQHPETMKKMEPVTWQKAIKIIQKEESPDAKIGIVVDSELGNLEAYNDRKLPINGDWMLPENFTLIYASADHPGEWTNTVIKECDRVASIELKKFIQELKDKGETSYSANCPIGILYRREIPKYT